jgi:hypothetical protein
VFVVTHVSIRTSDVSRTPRGCPFTDLRNAPLPRQRTEDRRRMTDDPSRLRCERLQHTGDHLILVTPMPPKGFVDVTEIECISHPHSHFIARTDRHMRKAFELRFRALLTTNILRLHSHRWTCLLCASDRPTPVARSLAVPSSYDGFPATTDTLVERPSMSSNETTSPRRSSIRPLSSDFCPPTPKASARGLSPVTSSARKPLFRPVSCYAFFKGWLLLSQPPGCFGISTSFPT